MNQKTKCQEIVGECHERWLMEVASPSRIPSVQLGDMFNPESHCYFDSVIVCTPDDRYPLRYPLPKLEREGAILVVENASLEKLPPGYYASLEKLPPGYYASLEKLPPGYYASLEKLPPGYYASLEKLQSTYKS